MLVRVHRKDRKIVADDMRRVFSTDDRLLAKRVLETFAGKWKAIYPDAVRCLEKDFDATIVYLEFPEEEWMHLRTTKLIERLNKEFNRRTKPMEHRDRRARRLHAARLRGDEDGSVVEECPVSEFRLSKTEALRRIFHTRKLTRP